MAKKVTEQEKFYLNINQFFDALWSLCFFIIIFYIVWYLIIFIFSPNEHSLIITLFVTLVVIFFIRHFKNFNRLKQKRIVKG